ncbi:post-transcriptional regulator [Cytobacillus sp. FJAT-54145]|uniref:Post-transcriptional regulator n=1 Tax=Cytobacillus spartinae TaxID=3299023 RepID=A0ABW6KKV6_9BACI
MKIGHEYDCFRNKVQPALECKLDEFSLLGYGTVNEHDLWSFLTRKKWRKPKEEIMLFEIVQDILGIKIGEYMNYATVEAFKLDDFSFDNEEDKAALLK